MRNEIPFVLLLALGLTACGGEPPPKAPEPAPAAPPPPKGPALQMKSELGSVDPAAIKRTFSRLEDKFVECQKRGVDRVEVLAGNVKFFVRLAESGAARWTYLEESEIGDRDTEKCLEDVVLGATWPKPDGGEAEARYTMELPLQATRPPNDWKPTRSPALWAGTAKRSTGARSASTRSSTRRCTSAPEARCSPPEWPHRAARARRKRTVSRRCSRRCGGSPRRGAGPPR